MDVQHLPEEPGHLGPVSTPLSVAIRPLPVHCRGESLRGCARPARAASGTTGCAHMQGCRSGAGVARPGPLRTSAARDSRSARDAPERSRLIDTPPKDGRAMRKYLVAGVVAAAALVLPASASAQSGHFVGTPTCTDLGTQVQCAGNVAPGQSFTFTAFGSSGPFSTPRNGQAPFTVTSAAPSAPAGSCPNPKW